MNSVDGCGWAWVCHSNGSHLLDLRLLGQERAGRLHEVRVRVDAIVLPRGHLVHQLIFSPVRLRGCGVQLGFQRPLAQPDIPDLKPRLVHRVGVIRTHPVHCALGL